MYDDYEKETIGMLLDIEHLYGEHEGRLAPVMATLLLISAPILLYIYFGLFAVMPIWLFVIVELFFSIRVIMLIPGRERHRVMLYKKRLNDDYTSTAELLNIKTIHADGCVEYINSKICYLVCCFNGTSDNCVQRSMQLRKFLENMVVDFEFDTFIHNVTDSPALKEYYERVRNFERNESAKNFVNIIDHSLELTEDTSVVQCTIYAIYGYRSDWKTLRTQITTAIDSTMSRCYKSVHMVTDAEVINGLLNRDIDSIIDIPELMRHKYANSQYASSKVLAYDLPEDVELVQGKDAAVKVIDDVAPKKSFHVEYKEGEHNRV